MKQCGHCASAFQVLSEQVAAQAPHPPRVQQEPAQLPHEGDSHSAVPVKVALDSTSHDSVIVSDGPEDICK